MKSIFDDVSYSCSKITTRKYSTSFSLGILFLDAKIRNDIYAIYGFVRLADEIVDTFHDYNKEELLDRIKREVYQSIDQGISLNPILQAFQMTVNKYDIDRVLIDRFLHSMEMDLGKETHDVQSFEEYVLGSAEVVGLMCLQVFVQGDKQEYSRLKHSAMKLGAAFQKVNFLRDLKDDYQELGRSYFPEVDLSNFGKHEKQMIEAGILNDFEEALVGIKLLPRCAKMGVYLAYIYYKCLFKKISKLSADRVMSERIRISNQRKVGLMIQSVVRYQLNYL